MISYEYRFGYSSDGFLTLQKRDMYLGIVPKTKWMNISYPFKEVEVLYKICKRREISKIILVKL